MQPYVPAKNQRLDRTVYRTAHQPVFFTIRTRENIQPFVNIAFGRAVVNCLLEERYICGCLVHVYALLPDHLHIGTSPTTDYCDVLSFVDRFKGKSARIGWSFGNQGRLWQPRSYDHAIRKAEDVNEIGEYILANPVRLGLVNRWEDYPLCGLVDPWPT